MKTVDIDKLFKNFVKDYLKTKPKLNGDDVDSQTEALYAQFNKTTFEELDGKTPAEFYLDKKDDLVEILTEHFKCGVPVSDYLIDALIDYAKEEDLAKFLSEETDSDMLLVVLEVLSHMGAKSCDNRLIALLFGNTSDEVKDFCAEMLSGKDLENELIEYCNKSTNVSGSICELLSEQKKGNKEIAKILEQEFLKHTDKAPEYCSYLVEYGDEGCLPSLYSALENASDYVCYKEIGLAIEALGGNFDSSKDFSKDKNYIKIKEAGKNEHKDNG